MLYKPEWEPLRPIGVLASPESNSEIDSTSHYRESKPFVDFDTDSISSQG